MDEDEAHALVDVGGVLGPGATIALPGMTGKALESLVEDIYVQKSTGKKQKVRKMDPKIAEPADPQEPATAKDVAVDVMPKLLEEAAVAQTVSYTHLTLPTIYSV